MNRGFPIVIIALCLIWSAGALPAGVVPESERSVRPVVDPELLIAPSLQIDLGGTWEMTNTGQKSVLGPDGSFVPPMTDAEWTTVQVPHPPFAGWVSWYRRKVDIPADWAGKRVTLRFGKTHYKTDVYWNGELVHVQIDAGYAYAVDLTGKVRPGEANELIVGTCQYFVYNPPHSPPYMENCYRGIAAPVTLTAEAPVRVADVFLKPSVRKGTLTLEVTVDRLDGTPDNGEMELVAWVKDDGNVVQRFEPVKVNMAAGQSEVVELSKPWPDAELWWPHRPYLYRVGVELHNNGQCIGGRTARFGFREFWIDGHLMRMNGKKLFVRRYSMLPYQTWPDGKLIREYLRQYRQWGYNAIRTHRNTSDYINEIADEEGLLVFVEMPIKHDDLPEDPNTAAWKMAREHVEGVVREGRNHPSVLLWDICNEVTFYSKDKYDLHVQRLE